MQDKNWKEFSDYLKRTGDEIKAEAQRLLTEVQDPRTQERIRGGLQELGVWARRTAEEAATAMEGALRQAGSALETAARRGEAVWKDAPWGQWPSGASAAPGSSGAGEAAPPRRAASKGKSAGNKKGGASKAAKKASPRAKKTVGRKKRSPGA